MASIELDVSSLLRGLEAFQEAFDRGAARGVQELALRMGQVLRANCPVRTGTTRDSIRGYYDPNTRRGLVVVAFPAVLWWRRNITPNYPRTRPEATANWARANGLAIIAAEIRRELSRLQ